MRTASTTASVDPRSAATSAAVAAYHGYIEALARAAQIPNPDDPSLARYVADPLLSLTRHSLQSLKDMGEVQVGAQTASVTSTRPDLSGVQPTVTIYACLDYSSLKLVYQSTRAPVPNSVIKNPRVSAVVTVWLYKTGRWLVNDTKQGSAAC